jgi:uncharacterized protein YbjT (DUF2867 family)
MSIRNVLLLGATGLVGRELLGLLVRDPNVESVRVVARRATGARSPKVEEHVFDLDEMEQHASLFAVDAIVCALGTTIKTAGSQERFRLVDHDYPVRAGRLGREGGTPHYLLVSSLGASVSSRTFYTRVKGEVERDILALDYPRTTIVRPSFLLGDRQEFRIGEQIVTRLSWLFPPSSKPVRARAVAEALVDAIHRKKAGSELLLSHEIRTQFS